MYLFVSLAKKEYGNSCCFGSQSLHLRATHGPMNWPSRTWAPGPGECRTCVEPFFPPLFIAAGSVRIEDLQKIVHQEDNARMAGLMQGQGFIRLNVDSETVSLGGISLNLLQQCCARLLKRIKGNSPRLARQGIAESLLLIINDEIKRNASVSKNHLFFENANGTMDVVSFGFRKVDTDDYDYWHFYMTGGFAVAPTFMITQHSEKDFFSSSSWDELVPLETGMTVAHVRGLLEIIMPQWDMFNEAVAGRTAVAGGGVSLPHMAALQLAAPPS